MQLLKKSINLISRNISKVVVMTAFVVSCTEDTLPLDEDLNTNLYDVVDTFNITATSILDTGTDLKDNPLSPIGIINDQVFGKTIAGVYTSFDLPYSNVNLGVANYDSVVFAMAYSSTYGKFSTGLDLQVYELNSEIEVNKYYSSPTAIAIKPVIIGSVTNIIPNTKDSILINGKNQFPQCRIKLDSTFGKTIFDASGTPKLKDNASFKSFFKGLYITSTDKNGENGMAYVSLYHPASRLILYYTKDGKSNSVEFPILAASHYVNKYTNDRTATSSTIGSNIPNGDEVIYISGLDGTIGKVDFPDMTSLKSKSIAKAELIFTIEDKMQEAPNRLFLSKIDTVTKTHKSIEDVGYNYTLFDGKLRSNYLNGNLVYQYVFDISKHLQKLSRSNNTAISSIYLHAGELDNIGVLTSKYKANRISLVGNKPQGKIRLKVTYFK